MNPFFKMNDGRSSVVHYVTERQHDVHYGDGDVRQEEADCTLCDRWVGHYWYEQTADDTPVTCIWCLASAFEYEQYQLVVAKWSPTC